MVRMVRVIHACCVLHNIAKMEDLQYLEELINDQYPDMQAQNMRVNFDEVAREHETGVHIRDELCHLLSQQN